MRMLKGTKEIRFRGVECRPTNCILSSQLQKTLQARDKQGADAEKVEKLRGQKGSDSEEWGVDARRG